MTRTNATTNAIISFLSFSRHMAFRNNVAPVLNNATGRFRTCHPSAVGTADIICCLKGGTYMEIEVKSGKDRLSENQKRHMALVQASGGIYIVAHDYDTFRIQYDQLMKTPRASTTL